MNPFILRIFIIFWGVREGSLGMGLHSQPALQKLLLHRYRVTILDKALNIDPDGIFCHQDGLFYRLTIGYAARKRRNKYCVPTFWLSSEQDSITLATHRYQLWIFSYIYPMEVVLQFHTTASPLKPR